MIVLSRKINESVVINNDVTITVVEIRGDKVRLGIVAPACMPVHRQEVYEAVHGLRPQATPGSAPPAPQISFVEISVDQLVHELGATADAGNQATKFTNEGCILPPEESSEKLPALRERAQKLLDSLLHMADREALLKLNTHLARLNESIGKSP